MKQNAIELLASAVLILGFSPANSQTLSGPAMIKSIAAPPEPEAISLLPRAKKQGKSESPIEQWEEFFGGRVVRNVTNPSLTPYFPDPAKANGTAVIIAPGGGFMMLSIDNEGHDVARWLADRGIAAFVLKYRLKPTKVDSQAFLSEMMEMMSALGKARETGKAPPTLEAPAGSVADAMAAIALVRVHAEQWHIDPNKIGFVGFSAGAMLTLNVGLANDPKARPNFIAPIYGPMLSRPVPPDAPPMFAAIAADDSLFSGMSSPIVADWLAAKRPAELHVYERGGHGFGMKAQGASSDHWIDEFYWWMEARGLLEK